jgi:hypothetical protein
MRSDTYVVIEDGEEISIKHAEDVTPTMQILTGVLPWEAAADFCIERERVA